MRGFVALLGAFWFVFTPASSALAQKRAPAASPLVSALERCRQISVPEQRLACFDRASSALVQAARSGQVTVVDRAQIQQAKRSLFGFHMPRLSIFSGDTADDSTRQLDTTIRSVEQLNSGNYRIVIAEGNAVWETTESRVTFDEPRKGQKVSIIAGSFGSYFLRINGQVGIRGRRVG